MKIPVSVLSLLLSAGASAASLEYKRSPADNPLRGLVPYADEAYKDAFPHSMEFAYFPMRSLMTDWGTYNRADLDKTLKEVSVRRNQLIFRVYIEYPGKGTETPDFLQKAGGFSYGMAFGRK